MAREKKEDGGILKGIFAGYLILVLHALLMLVVALLVVFLRGVVEYMLWIFLGGVALIGLSAYLFYRRIKKGALNIGGALNDPSLRDRPLEISFLGGLASVRFGRPGQFSEGDQPRAIESRLVEEAPRLEDPEAMRRRELARLVLMLERELITQEEYDKLKQDLLKN
ncbi:hypothetical protein SAMN05660860_03424 [Geoalkalibacter ferrihydriticus]|uniref:SHOCT domain-containing protein n=2 Tax=Geoalkalibacter ferrihydriticus TaxID=392333 RepID=A0A0C2DPX5_9BACT|nr:hypothetical protein [Geoalkalibacter ferrihydriticus]KIH75439.1 hypothetical protein GFER_16815 [Geoalkalibacter ferrihydriticus DSM 17813]SDM93470.1 hypothetical protein SAMN05660860_03424 [Geoalkalibacter ferrihydriticus]